LTVTAFARSIQRISWTDILLTISFAGIALYTSRMIPLFAIVVVPIAANTLGEWLEQEYAASPLMRIEKNLMAVNTSSSGAIWLIVLILAVVIVFRSGRAIDPQNKGNTFDQAFFPVQAVHWLNQNPQNGHMFNEFDWGGYLVLTLSPRRQIFMDGHTHIYGEALTREYETVVTLGKGWQDILQKYHVEWAIVRTDSPMENVLAGQDWEVLYRDETAVILRKE
jgi:hypothetical protein